MKNRLREKRKLISIALVAILIIALPLMLILVRQSQDPRSRASYNVEAFLAGNTGVNVIEAVHTDIRRTNGSPYRWDSRTLDGVTFTQVNPNDNERVYYEAAYNKGAEMVYNINFPQAGTYYFYARTSGAGENADSFHYGLDGNYAGSHAGYYEGETGTNAMWNWTNKDNDGTRSKIVVNTPGFHTFHIWMRESGTRVHRFRIITNSAWSPSSLADWGPTDETLRGTITVGTPTPGPTSTPTPIPTSTPTPVPGKPDLVVDSVTNWPPSANPNEVVNPTVRICNIGTNGSGQPFRVRIRSISDATGENRTIFHDETSSGIAAGACRSYNFANYNQALTLPSTPGNYTGQVYVDPPTTDAVKESNESNNEKLVNYSIKAPATPTPKPTNTPTPIPGKPDLTITNAYITHVDCVRGTTFTVKNIGSVSTNTSFNVSVNGKNFNVSALSAGQSKTQWVSEAAYLSTTTVVADSTNVISESNEANNTYSQFIPDPSPPPGCVGSTATPTKAPTSTPNTPTPWPTTPPITYNPTSPPQPTIDPSCPTPPSDTGVVTMSVLVQGGTYRIWSRMKSSSSTNNAYMLRVRNDCPMIVGDSPNISSSSWTWVDYKNGNSSDKMTVTLPAGSHIITLYGYEENVDVDKLLFTTSLNCVPTTASGDNCPAEAVATPTNVPTNPPTVTSAPTPTSPPSSSTPRAHWRFEGNANDSSGNGYNGSARNGASYATGKINQALSLDSIDDFVEVSGLIGNPQNMTITAWVNLTSKNSNGAEVISLGDNVGLRLDYGTNGAGINAFYWGGSSWKNTLVDTPPFLNGGWHHITYVIDTTTDTQRVYVDRNLAGTTNHTENISYTGNGTNTFIGRHGNGGTYYFGGQIDDVRIYNRALNQTEVTAIYNEASSSTPTPVPGSTKLNFQGIKLHGVGSGGDNTNPNSPGNPNPQRTNRAMTVELMNASGNTTPFTDYTISFNSSNGTFGGVVVLPDSVASGEYLVKIKVSQYLKKQVPGIVNLVKGNSFNVSGMELVTGDINNDNSLSIADYNILIDCYSDLLPAKNCSDVSKKESADLSDDGKVNANDYNLFLRELSVVEGD